jgi:hypothetical protein
MPIKRLSTARFATMLAGDVIATLSPHDRRV